MTTTTMMMMMMMMTIICVFFYQGMCRVETLGPATEFGGWALLTLASGREMKYRLGCRRWLVRRRSLRLVSCHWREPGTAQHVTAPWPAEMDSAMRRPGLATANPVTGWIGSERRRPITEGDSRRWAELPVVLAPLPNNRERTFSFHPEYVPISLNSR